MKKPLQVGERVRVYDGPSHKNGEVVKHPPQGYPGSVCVLFDEDEDGNTVKHLVHEKECIRLRPKKKPDKYPPRIRQMNLAQLAAFRDASSGAELHDAASAPALGTVYISQEEVNALLAEARAKAFEEAVEIIRNEAEGDLDFAIFLFKELSVPSSEAARRRLPYPWLLPHSWRTKVSEKIYLDKLDAAKFSEPYQPGAIAYVPEATLSHLQAENEKYRKALSKIVCLGIMAYPNDYFTIAQEALSSPAMRGESDE